MTERADLLVGYNEGNKREVVLNTSALNSHVSQSHVMGWYKNPVVFR